MVELYTYAFCHATLQTLLWSLFSCLFNMALTTGLALAYVTLAMYCEQRLQYAGVVWPSLLCLHHCHEKNMAQDTAGPKMTWVDQAQLT